LQLVNGWNNVEDNNSGKTVGITTAWTGKRISWYNSYYAGPEKSGTNNGWRNTEHTALTLRYENYNDHQGFITGQA
jgi:hypothetical protein